MTPLELRRRCEEMNGTVLDQIKALVEVESPSLDLSALTRCANVTADIGREILGVAPKRFEFDGVPLLQWGADDDAAVAMIGHFDTVHPIGTLASHPFRIEDGYAYGPGILDMKAGVLEAFVAASLVGLDRVTIVVNGDEELGSPTSRQLIEQVGRRVAAALVLEPAARGALKTARKGTAIFRIRVFGREAHAGLEPEDGVNATLAMAHAAISAANLADPALETTVTPTLASAGTSINTVPGDAELHVDVRAWTGGELARIEASLRALESVVDGAALVVDRSAFRPPLEVGHTSSLFELAQAVASDSGLGDLRGVGVGGGSDGNLTAAVGTPTLDGLGPVGDGAHTAAERIELDELPKRTALVAGLIEQIRSGGGRSASGMTNLQSSDD